MRRGERLPAHQRQQVKKAVETCHMPESCEACRAWAQHALAILLTELSGAGHSFVARIMLSASD